GEPGEALGYWEDAGHRALERASFLEAAEHFRRAVEALDVTHPAPARELERGELLSHWGAALQAGRSPAADVGPMFARAQETYRRARTPERQVPAMRGLFLMHS